MLLRSTLDLLSRAYRALNRDAALQSMIEAFHASGIPPVIDMEQPAGQTGGDLRATLQAAERDAASDPERAVALFRELLGSPSGASEYLIAREACGPVVVVLAKAGRFAEALRLCDLLITSGGSAGLGDWGRLDGKCRRLNVQLDAGLDPRPFSPRPQP